LTSVALIEDHDEYRAFIAQLLRMSGRYALASSFGTAEAALSLLPKQPAAVALVDIELPGQSGIEAVAQLRVRCPEMHCVMLTGHEDADHLFAALAAGASGYLLKKALPREILAGLDEVLAGGAPMSHSIARRVLDSFARPVPMPAAATSALTPATLTFRETEIMQLLAHGYTYKEIGRKLGISAATVKNHLYRVYEKLAVRSRTEAVVKWLKS
jgi:DNA-binding NarL/FixJ family response regulator